MILLYCMQIDSLLCYVAPLQYASFHFLRHVNYKHTRFDKCTPKFALLVMGWIVIQNIVTTCMSKSQYRCHFWCRSTIRIHLKRLFRYLSHAGLYEKTIWVGSLWAGMLPYINSRNWTLYPQENGVRLNTRQSSNCLSHVWLMKWRAYN